jgi:hypothetical protein
VERGRFGGYGGYHGAFRSGLLSFSPFFSSLRRKIGDLSVGTGLTDTLPPLQDAALRISHLLSTLTDSQRQYLIALSSYRASLKDVLARETALRTVVRDREILVGRLIKIGNKKPKENGVEEHLRRVEEAQRELRACESASCLSPSFHFLPCGKEVLMKAADAHSLLARRRTRPRCCQAALVPRLVGESDEEHGRTGEGYGGECKGGGGYFGRVGSG